MVDTRPHNRVRRLHAKEDRLPTGPPRHPKQHVHEAIMSATAALLREVGYAHLTIEAIAARAGASKATVYRWWLNKPLLVLAALQRQDNSTSPIARTGDTRTDLRAVIQATCDVYRDPSMAPTLTALAVELLSVPEARAQLNNMARPRRRAARDILQHASDRGELPRNVDTDLLVTIYSATIAHHALVTGKPLTHHLVDQLVALLLDAAPPTRAVG
jgi:AcrR family transcriptional regulator